MQDAQTYLEIVRSRGERRLELRRVYRNLQNKELFLRAYAKLYSNEGALTPGIDPADTVDNMSLKKIDAILTALQAGTYQWKPSRRIYRPKKNGTLRPVSIPGWNDKLLQEVIRLVLSAYYEPQFSDASHGFRPGRGCHTALQEIRYCWKGTKWFIEGDIKGAFDNIDHSKLLEIIGRNIKDERFLKLLSGMLDAGYLEDWKYYQTYSGTPQGGIASPILANIYFNELDTYIERELIPQYTLGKARKKNPEYARLDWALGKSREQHDIVRYRAILKEKRKLPSKNPNDPHYRRLRYVRYADDLLLGFIGPKSEAEDIKQKLGAFLCTLGLTLSVEKTLITHATTGRARFLGYDISIIHNDNHLKNHGKYKSRTVNAVPVLSVPTEVTQKWKARVTRKGKPFHRAELMNNPDFDIVVTYNMEFQGLVNYYTMAYDVAHKLHPVKYAYLQSLVKTLAAKHKQSATWVYRRYYRTLDNRHKAIVVEVQREGHRPLFAKFAGQPIRVEKRVVIQDARAPILTKGNELVKRLLTNQCELCGATKDIQVHHIRKLKDLNRRYAGRSEPPAWVARMIQRRRKTLIVCAECHRAIHAGNYDGPKLN
jgi:group II intron reverse transcriptase/maturase